MLFLGGIACIFIYIFEKEVCCLGDVVFLHRHGDIHKMYTSYLNKNYIDSLRIRRNQDKSFSFFNGSLTPEWNAKRIRSMYHSDSFSFPISEFANDHGIDVFTDDLSEIESNSDSGVIKGYLAIKPNNERPVIVVSKNESYGHRRWTVAHEIWHYFKYYYDHPRDVLSSTLFFTEYGYYESVKPNSEEDLANRFAAELLMPKKMFSSMYRFYSKASRDPNYLIPKLSDCFKVSEKAALTRIVKLNLL